MVELQIVILAVAGSSPVGYPTLAIQQSLPRLSIGYRVLLQNVQREEEGTCGAIQAG